MLAWLMFLSLLVPSTGNADTVDSHDHSALRYRGIERLLAKFAHDLETAGAVGPTIQNR